MTGSPELVLSAVERAAELLRDAGTLLERSSRLWDDNDRRKSGERTHYLIDADVLVSYATPEFSAQRPGSLFRANPDIASILSTMMSDFIARELEGADASGQSRGSLLIAGPHVNELHDNVLRSYEVLMHRMQNATGQVNQVLDLIRSDAPLEDLVAALLGHANVVMEALGGDVGPLGAMKRLGSLPAGRLTRLSNYQDRVDDVVFRFPRVPVRPDDEGYPEYARLYIAWKEAQLQSHHRKSPRAIQNDAQVLAAIEWLNGTLPRNRRVVLVTGSQSIYDAAARISADFESRYLRHPQAFLTDRRFFARSEDFEQSQINFRTFDWLNLLLPTFIDSPEARSPLDKGVVAAELTLSKDAVNSLAVKFREAVEQLPALKNPDQFVGRVESEWSEQVRASAVRRGLVPDVTTKQERAAEIAKELLARIPKDWDLARFSDFIREHAQKRLPDFYGHTIFLGVVARPSEDAHITGIPALRFEDPPDADGLYKGARDIYTHIREVVFSDAPQIELHDLYRELDAVDRDKYHAMVLHALTYAVRGHWFGAKTLCQVALDISERLSEVEKRGRRGREASYLMAVAYRHIAISTREREREQNFHDAHRLLDKAQEREDHGARPDPRFASERIDQELTRIALGLLMPSRKAPIQPREAQATLAARTAEARDIVRRLQDAVPGQHNSGMSYKGVRKWVIRQLFSSVTGLAMIMESKGIPAPDTFNDTFPALLEAFRARKLSPESGKFRDRYSDIVYWCALVRFAGNDSAASDALSKLEATDVESYAADRVLVSAMMKAAKGIRAGSG